jgi:3-keto-disaccharide hydrolase
VRLGLALIFAATLIAAQDQSWHPLFDGSTSKGWVDVAGKTFPTHSWAIEDGCLKALARKDGFEDIRTVDTFKSYELQFEWKLAKLGNSGVKYLIQRTDDWANKEGRQARARGLEYQLVDIYSPDAADPTRITGALYSILAPSNANWKIGEFNESRLIVNGAHVEHWLNGVRVLSYETTDPKVQSALRSMLPKESSAETPLATESPISLQNHGSETWFKKIRIRPLP